MTKTAIICDECGEYIWPEENPRACEDCEAVIHRQCVGVHFETHVEKIFGHDLFPDD